MREQTFYDWLTREAAGCRMALLGLYEFRDQLLYEKAPALRRQYLALFGTTEEAVLAAELDTAMLRRKAELIQIARNRREKIDLAAIDAQVEKEKRQRIAQTEQKDLTLCNLPQLTEEARQTLQKQYRDIIRRFHPEMNPEISDAQKLLYQKAVEAYQRQDADAMQLIYQSLFGPEDSEGISLTLEPVTDSAQDCREDFRSLALALGTDYSLARRLYDCFAPLEEDAVVQSALRSCQAKQRDMEEKIAKIRAGFPFNAEKMLNDRALQEEYRAELRLRARRCEEEQAALNERIRKLLEEANHG